MIPRWLSIKEYACHSKRCGFNLWVRKIPWRRKWQPTPVFLPGESHGQRSLMGYSPWGCRRVRHDLVTEQKQQKIHLKPLHLEDHFHTLDFIRTWI